MNDNGRDRTHYPLQSLEIGRRVFLQSTAALAAGTALASLSCAPVNMTLRTRRPVRFGIVTDCHYADIDPVETRFYRESLDKLAECVARMNDERVDFLVELGDFKDEDTPAVESRTLEYLRRIETVFRRFDGPRYHVLGNHDMDSLSKRQFLQNVRNTGVNSRRSYYSFNVRGLHCVVLDANYTSDGADYDHHNFHWTDANVPLPELRWLQKDLAKARGPVVVFIHQLLDGTGPVYVKNAAEVRQILRDSGKVLAVFQGHHHEGGYNEIGGIHYYTLKSVVEGQGLENGSYAVVEVQRNGRMCVTGYRKAERRELPCRRES